MNRNLIPRIAAPLMPVLIVTARLLSGTGGRKNVVLMVYQVPVVPRSGIRHVHPESFLSGRANQWTQRANLVPR